MGLDSYWARVLVYAIGLHLIQVLFSLQVNEVSIQYSAATFVIVAAIIVRALWLLKRNRFAAAQTIKSLYNNTPVLFMAIFSFTSILFMVAMYYISAPTGIIALTGFGLVAINSFLAVRYFG